VEQHFDSVKCPNCHAVNLSGAEICWQCGHSLHADEASDDFRQSLEESADGRQSLEASLAWNPEQRNLNQTGGILSTPETDIYVTLGWIFVAFGVICCCCLLPIGIGLGLTAYWKGDKRGLWVVVAGLVALLVGICTLLILSFLDKTLPWEPRSCFLYTLYS
jgi:hypothetical protein